MIKGLSIRACWGTLWVTVNSGLVQKEYRAPAARPGGKVR